jgi:ribosomal protein L35
MPKMKSNRGASKSFRKTATAVLKGKRLIRVISLQAKAQKGKEI